MKMSENTRFVTTASEGLSIQATQTNGCVLPSKTLNGIVTYILVGSSKFLVHAGGGVH